MLHAVCHMQYLLFMSKTQIYIYILLIIYIYIYIYIYILIYIYYLKFIFYNSFGHYIKCAYWHAEKYGGMYISLESMYFEHQEQMTE